MIDAVASIDTARGFDPATIVPNTGQYWVKKLAVEGDYARCEVVAAPFASVAITPGTIVFAPEVALYPYPDHKSAYAFLAADRVFGYRRRVAGDNRQ